MKAWISCVAAVAVGVGVASAGSAEAASITFRIEGERTTSEGPSAPSGSLADQASDLDRITGTLRITYDEPGIPDLPFSLTDGELYAVRVEIDIDQIDDGTIIPTDYLGQGIHVQDDRVAGGDTFDLVYFISATDSAQYEDDPYADRFGFYFFDADGSAIDGEGFPSAFDLQRFSYAGLILVTSIAGQGGIPIESSVEYQLTSLEQVSAVPLPVGAALFPFGLGALAAYRWLGR